MRNLLKHFLTYGLGNMLQSALSFLLLPIYLRFFAPQEYGVIATLIVMITLLNLFISGGALNGLVRLYYERVGEHRKILVGNTIIWHFTIGVAGGILLFVSAELSSLVLFKTSEYAPTIRMLGLLFFLIIMTNIPPYILRLDNKSKHYVFIMLLSFIVDFLLKLYFIVFLNRGITGYFESSIIANFVAFIVGFFLIKQNFRLAADFVVLKQLLRLGSPYIINGLSMWTLDVSDRILLARFSGEASVGIYALAYSFANLFGILLATPVGLLIDPYFFSYTADKSETENKQLLRRMFIYYILLGGITYLAIALSGGDILRIFSLYFGSKQQYLDAAKLIPIITLAPFLYFLESQATLAALLIKRPEIISFACVIGALFNFLLNLFIIPRFAAVGAAATTVAAYLLLCLFAYWLVDKSYRVHHDWRSVALLVFYLILAYIIGAWITTEKPILSLVVKLSASLGVFICLALITPGIISNDDKHWLQSAIPRFKMRHNPP